MQRFGDYALLERLGQGSGGTAHLARRIEPGTTADELLVLKRLHSDLVDRKNSVRRFRHEALIAISVASEHVVRVHDVGAVGATPYIAMEHIDGVRMLDLLRFLIARETPPPVDVIAAIIDGGLLGLAALHDAVHPETAEPLGVVHRDISPSNLIVSYGGRLKLIDMGLGKSNVQDWQTRTGAVLGSLGYMAPEQVTGRRVDHRADVYALTAVLYELLARAPYVPRSERREMLQAMEAPRFEPPSARRPDVPPELDTLVADGLAHDPDQRPATAGEMRARLRAIVAPAHPGKVAAFLIDLVDKAYLAEGHRRRELVHEPVVFDDDGEDREPTVIFARRESTVRTLDEVHESGDEPDGDPTAPVTSPMADPSRHKRAREPTIRAEPGQEPAPARAGVPLVLVAGLLVMAVAVTVFIDRLLLGPFESDAPMVSIPKPPSPAIRPTAAKAIPTTPPPVATEAPSKRPPARRVRPRSAPPVAVEIATPVPAPPLANADAVRAEVRRLTMRSEALRRRRPDAASEVDAVLTDISVWSASTDYATALAQLARLEESLNRIAGD